MSSIIIYVHLNQIIPKLLDILNWQIHFFSTKKGEIIPIEDLFWHCITAMFSSSEIFWTQKMQIHTSQISFFATISLIKLCIFWREVKAPSGCSALFVDLKTDRALHQWLITVWIWWHYIWCDMIWYIYFWNEIFKTIPMFYKETIELG